MRRALVAASVALLLLTVPASAQVVPTSPPSPGSATPTEDRSAAGSETGLASFAGAWWRHGFSLTIGDDGTAEASWRTYQVCGPGVSGACDRFEGSLIINGGHADIVFESSDVPAAPRDWTPDPLADKAPAFPGVQLPIAHGRVVQTTEPRFLRLGPIDLAMLPYDTGALAQDGDGILVCKESPADADVRFDQMTPEQRERWEHRACGA